MAATAFRVPARRRRALSYPLLVTGQVVSEDVVPLRIVRAATPSRAATSQRGRLHHSARFA